MTWCLAVWEWYSSSLQSNSGLAGSKRGQLWLHWWIVSNDARFCLPVPKWGGLPRLALWNCSQCTHPWMGWVLNWSLWKQVLRWQATSIRSALCAQSGNNDLSVCVMEVSYVAVLPLSSAWPTGWAHLDSFDNGLCSCFPRVSWALIVWLCLCE